MLKKIRSLGLNFNPSYIEIYDNVLSKDECEKLIGLFNRSGLCPGYTVRGIMPEHKKSIEIPDMRFSHNDAISKIIQLPLCNCKDKYREKYPAIDTHIHAWHINDDYTFKKFESEDDGFKIWHTEQGPKTGERILVWMFYLNNAKSGTEFFHYPTVSAKMGRCIIWPASWSHIHRSELPNKGLKYIITGWISFK